MALERPGWVRRSPEDSSISAHALELDGSGRAILVVCLTSNASSVSASVKVSEHDYHLHIVELQNTGPTTAMTLTTFIALCSELFAKFQSSCYSGPRDAAFKALGVQ